MKVPASAWIGLAIVAVSQTCVFLHLEPFWSWHTPIAWTGWILFADGLVWSRRGSSWLRTAPGEFVFLAVVSFGLWLVFEFFNLFIRNWQYINLPERAVTRDLGYLWAFASIWPAIFETAELVSVWRGDRAPAVVQRVAPSGASAPEVPLRESPGDAGREAGSGARALTTGRWVSTLVGAALLAWPIVWPSRWLAAPVWLGFIFLLEPLDARFGGESLLVDLRLGRPQRLVNLLVSGLLCGFLWESWNYWALTKWIYTVPILPNVRIFEMPVLGYFGFPAFALECVTMYVTVRLLLWRGRRRPVAL